MRLGSELAAMGEGGRLGAESIPFAKRPLAAAYLHIAFKSPHEVVSLSTGPP